MLSSKSRLQVIAQSSTSVKTIPLQLAFSSGAKDRYQVNMAQYDRSGRMNYEHFDVSPAGGTVDPLPTHIGSLGGLTKL